MRLKHRGPPSPPSQWRPGTPVGVSVAPSVLYWKTIGFIIYMVTFWLAEGGRSEVEIGDFRTPRSKPKAEEDPKGAKGAPKGATTGIDGSGLFRPGPRVGPGKAFQT